MATSASQTHWGFPFACAKSFIFLSMHFFPPPNKFPSTISKQNAIVLIANFRKTEYRLRRQDGPAMFETNNKEKQNEKLLVSNIVAGAVWAFGNAAQVTLTLRNGRNTQHTHTHTHRYCIYARAWAHANVPTAPRQPASTGGGPSPIAANTVHMHQSIS